MSYVMKVVLDPPFDKADHVKGLVFGDLPSAYLRTFDPDGNGGRGTMTFTSNILEAMLFDDLQAVMRCWKTQSRTVPLRPDGRPNRPLTAFSISPELVP